jgi:hypothetical protein
MEGDILRIEKANLFPYSYTLFRVHLWANKVAIVVHFTKYLR